MRLPAARGPLSNFVIEHLRRAPHKLPGLLAPADDPLRGDDFHLALLCTFLVQGCSFEDVAPAWQWNATLVEFRAGLERRFETALTMSSDPADGGRPVEQPGAQDRAHAPAAMLARGGSPEQLDTLLDHRALMTSTVADVWSWLVPRTHEQARAAVIAFGDSVRDDAGDAPIASLPGVTLARANVLWLLALQRSHGVALAGALAVAESIAARADRELASAAERLGLPELARDLERSAARVAAGKASAMAAELAADSNGAAEVAKGERWMLAVTRRWASATAAGPQRPATRARTNGSPIRSA